MTMKTKIDNTKAGPDENVFPQLRRIDDIDDTYIYLFYSYTVSLCLSHSDFAVRTAEFEMTDYFTGSITLSND